ncbi:MAG: 50S ribosomal protein L28 [Clostridiales bacterium]|jgi:large subunit ribosomal protein L28|nr:50S ribosomal protein L28 [Clostridiales bacterium]
MSRVCVVCQKGQATGNKVSHSNRKTRRTWGANVHMVTYKNPDNTVERGYVCTRCLRSGKINRI